MTAEAVDTRPEIPESELIARSQQGDDQSYLELFDRHLIRLRGFFINRVGPEETEDFLQNVFIKSWQSIGGFEQRADATFSNWLYAISRNLVSDKFRRDSKLSKVTLDEDNLSGHLKDQEDSEEIEKENKEIQFDLDVIADILSPRQKEVFLLRHQGNSVEDTASILGIEKNNVKVNSTKARKKIEDKFLKPRGIDKTSTFARMNRVSPWVVAHAFRVAKLNTFKLFNIRYTTEKEFSRWLKEHNVRKQNSESLIPLPQLPVREYLRIAKYHEEYGVVTIEARCYIAPKSYHRFQAEQKIQPSQPRFRPSDPSADTLISFAADGRDYNSLSKAAKKGELKAQKVRHRWFSTQRDIDTFRRNSYLQSHLLPLSSNSDTGSEIKRE